MQVSMTTQSDESSESLALYTFAQIEAQSLWVGGVPPYPLFGSETEKTTQWMEWTSLLQRLDENVLS